jgi:sulfite exporter TauE/SafE
MGSALLIHASMAAVFVAGLLGSVHCVGMCGGIVGALTAGIDPARRQSRRRMFPFVSAYNLGRITSYAVAGAIAGAIGQGVLQRLVPHYMIVGHLLSAVFMIALGLYLGGWWMGLSRLERVGQHLWRRIEPFGRRLLPVRTPAHALALGLLWGWLPCGLVYSALAWSFAAGGALQGALIMLAFGAGTLPTLLALGGAGSWLVAVTRRAPVRAAVGALAVAFGLYSAGMAFLHPHMHMDHSTHVSASVAVAAGRTLADTGATPAHAVSGA